MVQEQIGSADVLDIMRVRRVDLGGYDTIVLGSSVWTDHLRANYPAQLVDHAEARAHFGGGLDIDAFGPLMRFLLARKAGVTASYRRIKPEVISSFAAAMRT